MWRDFETSDKSQKCKLELYETPPTEEEKAEWKDLDENTGSDVVLEALRDQEDSFNADKSGEILSWYFPDTWHEAQLQDGAVIYQLRYQKEENGVGRVGKYFTDQATIESCVKDGKLDWDALEEKLQVAFFKNELQSYRVSGNIAVAKGVAKENDLSPGGKGKGYGTGGGTQYFIPNVSELVQNGQLVPVESRYRKPEVSGIHSDKKEMDSNALAFSELLSKFKNKNM